MLYILLSGMPPFYGDNEQQIFDAILRNKVDFDSDPWPKVSEPAKVRKGGGCQLSQRLHRKSVVPGLLGACRAQHGKGRGTDSWRT